MQANNQTMENNSQKSDNSLKNPSGTNNGQSKSQDIILLPPDSEYTPIMSYT